MTLKPTEMFAIVDSGSTILEIFYYENAAQEYADANFSEVATRVIPVLVTPIKKRKKK